MSKPIDLNQGGNPTSKSRKQILLELLQLEGEDLGNLGKTTEKEVENNETINDKKSEEVKTTLTKPKKQLTEKQLESLKKGQEIRNANRNKRAEDKKIKEEEEKKVIEEKLVKKAIALKKKQLKKQALLDEISSEEEIEVAVPPATHGIKRHEGLEEKKVNVPLVKQKAQSLAPLGEPIVDTKPKINIKFY
jgi:hypothetical protein